MIASMNQPRVYFFNLVSPTYWHIKSNFQHVSCFEALLQADPPPPPPPVSFPDCS
jgi:hypothetical protein